MKELGKSKTREWSAHALHSLKDMLVIAVCGTICGADNWEEIAEFGKSKREWFATFLELENGIPSHDTFRRVFILLDNAELKGLFIDWISSAVKLSKGSARQYRWQEFARKQRANQRQKGVKYSW